MEFSKRFEIKYDVPLSFPSDFGNFEPLRKLLVVHALNPGMTLTMSYRIAGLHPEQGIRAKNKLIADGMVREHAIVTKGSGGHFSILELMAPAIEVLKRMEIASVELKGRGSFLHRFYVNCYLSEWAKAKQYKFWKERWLDGTNAQKCIDFVYCDEYERLNAIEVFLSGEPNLILESAKRCAAIAGIHSVALAFNDKKMMKGVKEILRNELMTFHEKISLNYLNEYCIDDERNS